MTNIIQAEQSILNEMQLATIAVAVESWGKMKSGQHLQDWFVLGEALLIGRHVAMKLAFTNEPKGKGYSQAFSEWKSAHNFHTIPQTAISDLLWILDNVEHKTILTDQLATLPTNKRIRINSPSAARQLVSKYLKARLPLDPNAPVKVSKQKELESKVADLEERLAYAETRDGSLFDIQHDTAKQIGRVIAESGIGRKKWDEIRKVVEEGFKARDKRINDKFAKGKATAVHAG